MKDKNSKEVTYEELQAATARILIELQRIRRELDALRDEYFTEDPR